MALVTAGAALPQTAARESFSALASITPQTPDRSVIRGLDPGVYDITLVTGDRVHLAVDRTGRSVVDVEPTSRADGSEPTIAVTKTADEIYAIPNDVLPLLAANQIERDLFNVGYLAANGYSDQETPVLPLIVAFKRGASEEELADEAEKLPGSRGPVIGLESLNSAGVGLGKTKLADFWSAVKRSATPPRALGAGLASISLDHKVTVALDESVPQIGAPEAWAAGYDGSGVRVAVLDTGIDATHPDLADNVIASASFIPGEDVTDGHGHGTHVASTIAGSGEASEGQYKGVAPGADLIVGKVLSNGGSGTETQIINGMEWAAIDQGADVVSMSLSCAGCPGDNTDPMELAVNRLTEQTGALFAIAAGNSGPGSQTIGSPASADEALTVAAVDKTDQLASFSSRGPRRGDGAFKPDIAAPGVAITAARASGTAMGTPVNDYYTTASGTSMATPHVAGTAAILAQKYPTWTATELKPALMSTAVDDGYTVYEQGAGRVDISRAVSQHVVATTAHLDFRNVPSGSPPVTKTVSYANLGDESVTLNLEATARSRGGPEPEGTLIVQPATLTVPAGGTATATVTLNSPKGAAGVYTGAIVATGTGSTRLSTPAAFTAFSELTVTVKPRSIGAEPFEGRQCAAIHVYGVDGGATDTYLTAELCSEDPSAQHSTTFLLPGGTYFAAAQTWQSGDGEMEQAAFLFNQHVTVEGAEGVVLDANRAERITIKTPRPATIEDQFLRWTRTSSSGGWLAYAAAGDTTRWVTPTPSATVGEFVFAPMWALGAADKTGKPLGDRPYAYVLRPSYERIPSSPEFAFSRGELAEVENYFHTDRGRPETTSPTWWAISDHDEETDPGLAPQIWFRNVSAPRAMTVFVGPTHAPNRFFLRNDDTTNGFGYDETGGYVFNASTRYEIRWGKSPVTPGPVLTPPEARLPTATHPFGTAVSLVGCSGCREANRYNGLILLASPDGRHTAGTVGAFPISPIHQHDAPKALDGMHLYHNGQEIPGYAHWICVDPIFQSAAECRSDQ